MNSRLLHRTGKILLSAGIVACVWLIAIEIRQSHERNVASEVVAVIDQIEIGTTSRTQAEMLLRPFGSHRVPETEPAIQFAFANRRWLPLLPPSQFLWMTVEFRGGVVDSRSVQFAEEPRRSAVIVQHRTLNLKAFDSESNEHRKVVVVGHPGDARYIVKIDEDIMTPAAQRHLDWQTDFRCFRLFRNCENLAGVITGINTVQQTGAE